MFIGEYKHTIDAKKRMFVPAKFRDELGAKFIITVGLDANCLFVFSYDEFVRLKEKLDAISITNRTARQFARVFFAGASEVETDKQGRIVVPENLRSYAKLENEVTVVGVSNRVEIWNTQIWEEEHSIEKFSPEEISEKMELLGL